MSADDVRRRIGVELSDAEVTELLAWYAALGRGLAAFPQDDLHGVESPVHSVPGPRSA